MLFVIGIFLGVILFMFALVTDNSLMGLVGIFIGVAILAVAEAIYDLVATLRDKKKSTGP